MGVIGSVLFYIMCLRLSTIGSKVRPRGYSNSACWRLISHIRVVLTYLWSKPAGWSAL